MCKGFSFIELIIALMIIGIVATVSVPWRLLQRTVPASEQFLHVVSTAYSLAYTQAVMTRKTHRLFFNLTQRIIKVEREADEKNTLGELAFEPIQVAYVESDFEYTTDIVLRNFYIQQTDELAAGGTKTVWTFIGPQGQVQPVIINFFDEETGNQHALVLNPFTVRMSLYDEFKRP